MFEFSQDSSCPVNRNTIFFFYSSIISLLYRIFRHRFVFWVMPAYFAPSCGSITALLVQFCCDKLFVDMWTCCTLSIPSMFSCLSPPFVWFSWWSQIVLNSLCKSLCRYVGPGSGFWFLGFLCFRASFLYICSRRTFSGFFFLFCFWNKRLFTASL